MCKLKNNFREFVNRAYGFTLLELVLVIAMAALLGASAQFFALPALGGILCSRNAALLRQEIERNRFTAQYFKHDVPIVGGERRKFQAGSGNIEPDHFEVAVESVGGIVCIQVITINHVGEIQ